jgi:hypothetical protein
LINIKTKSGTGLVIVQITIAAGVAKNNSVK